jgi:hypothetical protein
MKPDFPELVEGLSFFNSVSAEEVQGFDKLSQVGVGAMT